MHPTTHVNAKASGSIKNQEFCVKDKDVITGGALEHCSITVLHCNALFFKGICTLTGCPSIGTVKLAPPLDAICLTQSKRFKNIVMLINK
jgi:hypothetical protein